MRITVNGDRAEVPEGTCLSGLLDRLNLSGRPVAVEVNGVVVSRDRFQTVELRQGDRIEIVTLVGGG